MWERLSASWCTLDTTRRRTASDWSSSSQLRTAPLGQGSLLISPSPFTRTILYSHCFHSWTDLRYFNQPFRLFLLPLTSLSTWWYVVAKAIDRTDWGPSWTDSTFAVAFRPLPFVVSNRKDIKSPLCKRWYWHCYHYLALVKWLIVRMQVFILGLKLLLERKSRTIN